MREVAPAVLALGAGRSFGPSWGSALPGGSVQSLADWLDAIACRMARLPVRDARTPEEVLGYDETGVPR